MSKQLKIHNSTAEFLIFQAEDKAEGIQVFYQDENIWATQEVIATLFDKGRSTITEHLKNIYQTGELDEMTTCRKFRRTTQPCHLREKLTILTKLTKQIFRREK